MSNDLTLFPTHTAVGVAVPDWTVKEAPDEDGFMVKTKAGVLVPRGDTPRDQIVDLVREQVTGLLTFVELPVDTGTVNLAAEALVAHGEKFQWDPLDFDRSWVLSELDKADTLRGMSVPDEAIVEAAAQLYARVTPGATVEAFAALPPGERGRWVAAVGVTVEDAVTWERGRVRGQAERTSRRDQVQRAADARQWAIDFEVTHPLPVEKGFDEWTDVVYTGSDVSISRAFEQFPVRRGQGNRKWTLVNFGNGADARDVPTRDLEAATVPAVSSN